MSRHDGWGPQRCWVIYTVVTLGHDIQEPGKETASVRGRETGFWLVLAEWLVDSGVKTKPFASGASIDRMGRLETP